MKHVCTQVRIQQRWPTLKLVLVQGSEIRSILFINALNLFTLFNNRMYRQPVFGIGPLAPDTP